MQVEAQTAPSANGYEQVTSVSGDSLCGGLHTPKCKISDLKKISTKMLGVIVTLGLPLLFVFIAYRFMMAWFALRQGNAGAYKEAVKSAGQAVLGFIIIIAVFGGLLLTVLKFFGVSDTLLSPISNIIGMLVPHAYAQETMFANPIPGTPNLFEFILLAVRFAVRFFLYPAIVVAWVWSGFSFVLAQGNPEALKNARKYLLMAFVSTIVIFALQGFLLSLQTSIKKILPSTNTPSTETVQPSNLSPSTTVRACDGKSAGDACKDGQNSGRCTASGVCDVGSPCSRSTVGNTCYLGAREGTCDQSSICILNSNNTLLVTCPNGTTNPPSCNLCPSPKVLDKNVCITPTNNPEALAKGCGVSTAKVGDRCTTPFVAFGTCQNASGALECKEQTGIVECDRLSRVGQSCSTATAPYGICAVKESSMDNTSYCKPR